MRVERSVNGKFTKHLPNVLLIVDIGMSSQRFRMKAFPVDMNLILSLKKLD